MGLLKIEKNKIYFHLDEERYLKLEIIGETKEKEIKNAFCSNAFLAAQVLNLSKNQERQALELKCHFFKRPIKILPKALNINFKDTIVKKLLKKMGKDKKLEDFKKTCILKIAGFTYFVCVLPYEDEDKENKENSEEILKEDFRLLNTKGGLSVKRTLINNRHSYEAIKLRPIKQALAPGLCLFFQGSLEFNDKTTKTMRTSLLDQIQQDDKSYLKIWKKYLIKSAQKSFNEAKEVGVLEIESVSKAGGNLRIRFKPALGKNKMEILIKKAQLREGSDLGVLEELDTQNEENLINFISEQKKQISKNNSQSIMIKDISGDDFIIDYDPSIKEGDAFHLNYMGVLNTLKKQYSTLDKTKKGLSANPNLGLILNIKENREDSDGDNNTADTMDEVLKEILSSYQTRALKLTKRVRKKIFKNKPTENQEKAIKIALNTPDIAIIQGPPGTGKTTVINAICERLFEEYPKDKNIKGKILLCAQGHDATNNARERIKVGGLPTFKFGAKKNAKEEQYKQDERLNERLRELAEILIESVRKKLQSLGDYENIEKISDLEKALRRYLSSPISELEFLKEIEKNAIFFDSSMRERLSQLKARQQKQEMPANLSIIHALRATQEGFEDDGVMRNYDLLESQFKENLTKEDRELLKSPKPNLEKLQELKIRLLEKNAPKRKYEIPKPNEEVVSLANDLLEILSSQSPNDKRIRVLLEYLSVLERTPWDLESLLRDYNFVFSSTIGQHNQALERKETPYFDSVIVDEAAKANPLELLMVMALAKERIILVGDDRQLPHYLDDEIGKKLEDESQDAQDEKEAQRKSSKVKRARW
ncbi:AAA domain-containing protein [Helicobacter pylori]|uniref:AAA domain-containing protein n=1 Tax=Helicobacter pylori TaxID=210 RepID=UPI001EE3E2AE|nr:AAA domain-containing protein [Helicobacter pylori]